MYFSPHLVNFGKKFAKFSEINIKYAQQNPRKKIEVNS